MTQRVPVVTLTEAERPGTHVYVLALPIPPSPLSPAHRLPLLTLAASEILFDFLSLFGAFSYLYSL